MAQFPDYRPRSEDTVYRPRVSYIMATKNHGEQLRKALDNVREFIQPADELVIVDGGSTDCTAAVIEENRDIITIFEFRTGFRGSPCAEQGDLSVARALYKAAG